jgi:hypothetical protein
MEKLHVSDYYLHPDWKVYIRLVKDTGLASFLIRFGTRSIYSHGEFVVVSKQGSPIVTLGSMFDPFGLNGVQLRPYHHIKPVVEDWFTAPGIELAYEHILKNFIGRPYDYLAILGIGLDKTWHDQNDDFCTETIARGFNETGHPLFNTTGVQPWRVTPRDIATSLAVKLFRHVRGPLPY